MERLFAQVPLNELRPAQQINTFSDLVNIIIRNAVIVAALISFALLVFGGLGVIMGAGGGDTKQMENGRNAIIGAVAGLVVILAAVWLVQIIESITGIPLLRLPGPQFQ